MKKPNANLALVKFGFYIGIQRFYLEVVVLQRVSYVTKVYPLKWKMFILKFH